MHLPQRRQLAELRDFPFDEIDGVIDLIFRRETANGETDRAVCELVATPERTQNVRRLQRRGRARGTRRHGDILDRHDQAFTFDEIETHVEIVRNAPLGVTVQVHLFDFR